MKLGISSFSLLLILLASNGFASLVGTDNASAGAYSDGWDNGDDGFITGAGAFGPWSLTTGASAAFFIGDSTGLAGPGANINSGSSSFGMWGESGYAEARRSFDSPLSVGQMFSIDLAVNNNASGHKGINIFDSGSNKLFNFNIGSSDYRVNDTLTGNGSIGSTYNANTAFNLSFTQVNASGGTWSIIRSGGVSSSASGTYSGVPANFHLYVGDTGGGSARDLFANNMSISAVPEASAFLAGTLVLGMMACRQLGVRRRKLS